MALINWGNERPDYLKYSKYLFQIAFYASILGLFLFIIDFGFDKSQEIQVWYNTYYFVVITLGIVATGLRYWQQDKQMKRSVVIFDVFSIFATIVILYAHFLGEEAHRHISFLYNDNWVKFAIILTFIREFSEQNINYKRTLLNPAQLFIASFFVNQ